MNPGGTPDKYAVSICDPVADSGTPGAPKVYNFDHIDGSSDPLFTGALKITSGVHDIVVYVAKITPGSETYVDVNALAHGVRVVVGEFALGHAERLATVKGGSFDISVYGKFADGITFSKTALILGDWSDQSAEITRGVSFALVPNAGKSLDYLQLNAEAPKFTGPAPAHCVFAIPFGKFGIAVVWAVWGALKKIKNPFTGKYLA